CAAREVDRRGRARRLHRRAAARRSSPAHGPQRPADAAPGLARRADRRLGQHCRRPGDRRLAGGPAAALPGESRSGRIAHAAVAAPMKTNAVRAKLKRGEPSVGTWLALSDPAVAQLMARTGFDWLTVELEHSPTSLETAAQMFAIAAGNGVVPLVRVPHNSV